MKAAPARPLHAKAKALVPNKLTRTLTFNQRREVALQTLRPLAFQLFLLVVHKWNQRARSELASVAPSKRNFQDYRFTLSLREVLEHLRPEATGLRVHHDYRHVKASVTQLSQLQVISDKPDVRGRRGRQIDNLLVEVEFREEGATVTYVLSPFFREALQELERQQGVGFAVVPLSDALRLADVRQLLMLVLACQVLRLAAPRMRTFDAAFLRQYFGLTDASYAEPRQVFKKVRLFAAAVNAQTDTKFKVVPVKGTTNSRRVDALRIAPLDEKDEGDEFAQLGHNLKRPQPIKPKIGKPAGGFGAWGGSVEKPKPRRPSIKPRIRRPVIEDREPESFPEVDAYRRLRAVALREALRQREDTRPVRDTDVIVVFGDPGEPGGGSPPTRGLES